MSVINPGKERNVGILGHGGVGKTTLIEHLLHDAGVTNRLGSIDEGNTVCDYLEEEIEQKHTIALKLCHLEWKGDRIHIIDHPGFSDFVGEVAATAPLLDGMVIIVDATTGIQVGTDNAWQYAEKYNVPRAIFINKLDRDNTDYFEVVQSIREYYGKQCVPLVVPIGSGPNIQGVVNIFDGDTSQVDFDIETLKEEMQDIVAETNDELLEKYLETAELTAEEFHKGLHDGITAGKIMPIIAGSVTNAYGINELLDLIALSFPSPLDRKVVVKNSQNEEVKLKIDPAEPFVAQVFRSIIDPYVGQLSLFRVLTGTLKSDSEVYNVNTQTKERVGKIFLMNGKEQSAVDAVGPGDFAALTKLKNTHFGDTLAAIGVDLQAYPIEMPNSMVKLAISPKTRADEDKIGEAMNRLAEEDPTFKHYRDESIGQHIIQGVGEMQLKHILERMKKRFNVEAETATPKVAFKETIRTKVEVQGKHKKQTGGHGQYGDVQIRLSPNERGAGYKFIDSIVGGVVPKQYIPHVDKGCFEALEKGVISGNPVVDVVVDLFYGSYHNVDSSEMAFKLAAALAIRKGVMAANPCLLEPVNVITVTIPEEYMGDITGDLNSRRGRIIGVEPLGGGRQRIQAHVPEAEVLRYSTDLRSMTQDRGVFTMEFDHYEEVPDQVAKTIIEAYEKSRTEED